MYTYSLFHQLSGTSIQKVVLFRVSQMSTLTSVNDTSRIIKGSQKYTLSFSYFTSLKQTATRKRISHFRVASLRPNP